MTSFFYIHRYSINMPEKALMDGIDEYIPPMISFLSKHVDKHSNTGLSDIRIGGVRDIEETVWSPRFGYLIICLVLIYNRNQPRRV